MLAKVPRSRFIAAGAALMGGAAVLPRRARAAQLTWRLASVDPIDMPTQTSMIQMAAAVKNETDGRFNIQVYPNSELGSQPAMLSQVRLGATQMLWMNMNAYATVVPIAQIGGLGFAFTSIPAAMSAMDGPFGAYIRSEFAAKGLYVFETTGVTGFRQMASSLRPIRNADDLIGYKVRTLPAPIFVDLFKTLGAAPVALPSDQIYTAAETHLVDGVELPLSVLQSYRVYEVQKYISITNHIWSGYLLVANPDAWKSLPSDVQASVTRNVKKFVIRERRDAGLLEDSVGDKLRREGLTFNTADVSSMRARLGPYYAKWKAEFGPTAWSLLESRAGKLGT